MLDKVVSYAEEYIDATYDSREQSEKARDYYDGYQWTEREVRSLKNRKQPAITINRIKPKVQFLKGMETQNRTDPKALPRTPNDDKSGEVSTDALRYVEERNNSDQTFSEGFQSYLIEGTEGYEVLGEPNKKKNQIEVEFNFLQWDRLFWDPHSRKKDFSDARYLGTLQWMDESTARERFPDAEDDFFTFDEVDVNSDNDTFEDKPRYFIDKNRKRIRVFFINFIMKGQWHYAIFSGGGFALKPTVSTLIDEDGDPEAQFIFQSAFVDRNGNRYGEVASYLDIQDEINKRRSKFLHLASVRQTFGSKGAVPDVAKLKSELSKPDGHVELNHSTEFGKDFGILPTNDMAAYQAQLLQEGKQEIDVVSVNSAMEGRQEGGLSGRAIQSLQQGGVVELGSLFDGHNYCRMRVYRAMFNRIKQFWTEERWVRVLGNDKDIKWTGINQKMTVREVLEKQGVDIPEEIQDPRLDAIAIGQDGQPMLRNPVNELDIDIIMDDAADTLTLQHEQFELLANMYQANPQAVPFQLVIKASQLRNKEELIKMIEGGDDKQKAAMQQAQQQMQAQQQEILIASAKAKIEKDQASAEKDLASANKMTQEAKQTVVETAMEVDEHTQGAFA